VAHVSDGQRWDRIVRMTLYNDGSPERLWHYTSGSGAKGIFESRTLWAGHLAYMSDTSEVGHAMSVSREVVERLKRELSEHKGALQRWTDYVTDNPPKSWAPSVFAVSFSEERDLLSQWRGYATGAGGPFCIGLALSASPYASDFRTCSWRTLAAVSASDSSLVDALLWVHTLTLRRLARSAFTSSALRPARGTPTSKMCVPG
jgi:hypothetical protein